jgi:hypothetical protein
LFVVATLEKSLRNEPTARVLAVAAWARVLFMKAAAEAPCAAAKDIFFQTLSLCPLASFQHDRSTRKENERTKDATQMGGG